MSGHCRPKASCPASPGLSAALRWGRPNWRRTSCASATPLSSPLPSPTTRPDAAADFAPAQLMPVPTSPARPPTQPSGVQGVVFFNYTLIPLTETARATPPIPFSFFDPKTGRYADLTIPSVPVTVQPGAPPDDLTTLTQSSSTAGEPDKELVLHGLAASRGRIAASLVPPQQQAWFRSEEHTSELQ